MVLLSDGEGLFLKYLDSITESAHYSDRHCVYLLDPNPETHWDSNDIVPRYVEFTFKKPISIVAYSLKMSAVTCFPRSWEVIGTYGSQTIQMDKKTDNYDFTSQYQYIAYDLKQTFKVEKVKFQFNEVSGSYASVYISNIDFLLSATPKGHCTNFQRNFPRITHVFILYYLII